MDTCPDVDPSELRCGEMINDTYRVVKPLVRGGMGQLYEVEHARLAGRYALKLIAPELSRDAEVLDRFRREAEIASRLRHPNIVQVIDFNTTARGCHFLVMELLEGEDLKACLRRTGAMRLPEAAGVVSQLASGLAAAHSCGVVHRDLKPENVFLARVVGCDEPLVKILDFGISKIKAATTRLTGPDRLMGTPQYMSPEQARGMLDAVDERTDQFALAAIAYELLTGEEAFRGEQVSAILYQVVHETPPHLLRTSRTLPARIKSVLLRGLAKERDERFAGVSELSRALELAIAEELGVPRSGLYELRSLPAPGGMVRRAVRHRGIMALAALVVVAVVAVAAVLSLRWSSGRAASGAAPVPWADVGTQHPPAHAIAVPGAGAAPAPSPDSTPAAHAKQPPASPTSDRAGGQSLAGATARQPAGPGRGPVKRTPSRKQPETYDEL